MLYHDNVTVDTPLIVKGWVETVRTIMYADLSKIKDANAHNKMFMARQLMEEIHKTSTLKDVLEKSLTGAKVLAIESGGDPSAVTDPKYKKYVVTDSNGKKFRADIPAEWERSLCGMYSRGLEQLPVLDAKTEVALDKFIDDHPVGNDKTARLDTKAGSEFLKLMKACGVSVVDKADPDSSDAAREDKLNEQSEQQMKSVYGRLPELAGADEDADVKSISNEYGAAPTPRGGGGGGGGNDDDDPTGDTTGGND